MRPGHSLTRVTEVSPPSSGRLGPSSIYSSLGSLQEGPHFLLALMSFAFSNNPTGVSSPETGEQTLHCGAEPIRAAPSLHVSTLWGSPH